MLTSLDHNNSVVIQWWYGVLICPPILFSKQYRYPNRNVITQFMNGLFALINTPPSIVLDVRLAWSTYQSSVLATTASSPQGQPSPLVQLYDTRVPRVPASILPSSSGASLVSFDRLHPFRLSTVHSGNVRIWDTRVSASPHHYQNRSHSSIPFSIHSFLSVFIDLNRILEYCMS